MEELIQRLETWLQKIRPAYFDILQPGLTDAELDQFEEALGFELPKDFRLLYKWRNAQPFGGGRPVSDFPILVSGYQWMSKEEILEVLSYMEGAEEVALNWWNTKWVPFLTDMTATEFCLDMAGSFDGIKGQILYVDGEDTPRIIMHSSIAKWLETVVIALESGIITGDEDVETVVSIEEYQELLKELNPGYPLYYEAEFN